MGRFSLHSLFSGMLPLFVLAHFGHHLVGALPVPLLPMIRSEFLLDYTQSGLILSVFGLSIGFGHLPAGWLADRLGPRILITIGISGVAAAGLALGLSRSFRLMIVCLALMGLLGGGYHPAAPPLLSAWIDQKNRGRALGLHMIGGSASFFLAPIIAAAIAGAWGWRHSFIILSIPTVLFGVAFYILLGRRILTMEEHQDTISAPSEASPGPRLFFRLVAFLALSTFNAAIFFSTVPFIPLFLVDHYGISQEAGAALLAFVYSAGFWASPLGGYLSDRWGSVPVVLGVCFLAGPVLFLINLAPYRWGIVVLLLIIGMIAYVRMPVTEAYIVQSTPERYRSTVIALFYFGGLEGGGVLAPAMGYLVDRLGFYYSFTIAGAAVLVVTSVCALAIWRSRD